jgi:hypothetical protein
MLSEYKGKAGFDKMSASCQSNYHAEASLIVFVIPEVPISSVHINMHGVTDKFWSDT